MKTLILTVLAIAAYTLASANAFYALSAVGGAFSKMTVSVSCTDPSCGVQSCTDPSCQ